MIQHLVLEDETTTYNVLVESNSGSPIRRTDDDYSSYNPDVERGRIPSSHQPQISSELRVKIADVHHTIQAIHSTPLEHLRILRRQVDNML